MRRVYIGFDGNDHMAYRAAAKSLMAHSSIDLAILPLVDYRLRGKGVYWRSYHVDAKGQRWDDVDGKPFSTDFSFTRFLIPVLEDFSSEPVLFVDADVLFRGDVKELFDAHDPTKAVSVVQHDHRPTEAMKMHGVAQTVYRRKNWSSVVVWTPSRNTLLTRFRVNNSSGSWLHAFSWLMDDEVGALPEGWNWLEGWSSPEINPKLVHFTRGTPDMIGDCDYADEWWSALGDDALGFERAS